MRTAEAYLSAMAKNYSCISTIICVLVMLLNGTFYSQAQNSLNCEVRDSITNEVIVGAIVVVVGTKSGTATDLDGKAVLSDIASGIRSIEFSYIGYRKRLVSLSFPSASALPLLILLQPDGESLDEIEVTSTRTHSRIDDLPIKVEVLGQDDMDEESSIVPSGIGSILGDLSVITIQRTNPVNGNDAVRMQGLDYKYTQMLRDGLPLYEGFSGSLGVLAIPPLDLKQVEIIKGSASTLYGGGAIGGLINFISRTPDDTAKVTLIINQSTLNETNLNAFISKRQNKIGTTIFAGATIKQAYDVNKDGFAEVPEQRNFIVHPRVFMYFSDQLKGDVGVTFTNDNRRGGDMMAVKFRSDSLHPFLFTEKVLRATADGHLTYAINQSQSLAFKTTGSWFSRSLDYNGFLLSAVQLSSYTEVNHLLQNEKHAWVTGTNVITEQFMKMDSDPVRFGNYTYTTVGLFSQEDWSITPGLTLEGGLRADHHSRYGWLLLPRAGFFLHPSKSWSLRMHYGSGYKVPNLFVSSNPNDYSYLLSVSNNVKVERSDGYNADIHYHTVFFEKLIFQFDQAFYYTRINNPTIVTVGTGNDRLVTNAPYHVQSIGTDSYARLTLESWSLYLGYNHTEAKQLATGIDFNMPFNPKDKFATTISYEIEGKWRFGIEAAYNANQYIYNNVKVSNYWFFAGMIERKFSFGSLVINGENLGDFRQSRISSLYSGTVRNPVFASLWGPVEGRVINLSLKIQL